MLYLFEYDTLFLLNQPRTTGKANNTFKYPLYAENSKTVFLLYYKTLKENWLPPAHQEQFEKIITRGFKYPLDKVGAYNAQEVLQNPSIELKTKPEVIFYMENKLPDTVEKWLLGQETKVRYLPSLSQMIENLKFKEEAWKEIQDYLSLTKEEKL